MKPIEPIPTKGDTQIEKSLATVARYLPDLIAAIEALSSELKLSRLNGTDAKNVEQKEE